MQTAEYIDKTIETLETCGWVQSHYGNEREGFCLLGALFHVYDKSRFPTSTYTKAKGCIINVVGGTNLARWNDLPGRTKEEVIEMLNKAKQNCE